MYNEYEAIYEELCDRVENGELTLEDAELINDAAYERYVTEFKAGIQRYYDDRLTRDKLSHNHDRRSRNEIRCDLEQEPWKRRVIKGKFHRKSNKNSSYEKIRNSYYHGKGTHALTYHGGNPYDGTSKYTKKDYDDNKKENNFHMFHNSYLRDMDKQRTDDKKKKWQEKERERLSKKYNANSYDKYANI